MNDLQLQRERQTPKERKKHWLKGLVISVAVLGLSGLMFIMMLLHRPGDYRPEILTPEQITQTEDYAVAQTRHVYNSANELNSFSVTFEQFQLNRLLSLAQQENSKDKIPSAMDTFRQPQIRINEDGLFLMGRVSFKNMDMILTIGFRLRLVDVGKVELELLPVKAGLIKLPDDTVRRYFADAVSILRRAKKQTNVGAGNDEDIFINIKPVLISSIEKLSQNEQVILPARFKVDDDKIVRVTRIEMKRGGVTLWMDPIKKK